MSKKKKEIYYRSRLTKLKFKEKIFKKLKNKYADFI